MKAIRLKTSDLFEPLGLGCRTPRFSWNAEGGKKQTACRVVVRTPEGETLFDSGRVEGDKMHCLYAGTPLTSRTAAIWRVCLWDEEGKEEWSEPARFETGLLSPSDWEAKWICGEGTDRKERLPADCYFKAFSVKEGLVRARLYATALGVYSAAVNGVTVSDVLAPGATTYEKTLYYQTYDVTSRLRTGENELSFTVADGWYKGKLGADQNEYVYGTQLKLFAQLELFYASGEKETIATDGSFLWSNDGPVRFSDLKDGEIYDARKSPVFARHAHVDGGETRIPSASDAPAVMEHEVFRPTLSLSPSGKHILDFKQNLAGYVRFRVHAPAGSRITLRLFEATDHGEYSDASLSFTNGDVAPVKQEIVYYAAGREDEVFQPEFFYSGFRYALVEGLGEVRPEDFEAVAVYSDLEFGGSFSSSDALVDRFFLNTLWSMKSNFVDVPTDCPQREKAGWTGDAQVFCRTAGYLADTKAFFRKWLHDVKDCQGENGMVRNVAPRIFGEGSRMEGAEGSCGWIDAAVIIPYTLWKMTGDRAVITQNLPLMLGFMDFVLSRCADKSMFSLPEDNFMHAVYASCRLPDSPYNKYIIECGLQWGEWCVPESQEPPEENPIPMFSLLKPKQEVTAAYVHYSMTLLSEMLRTLGDSRAELAEEYAEGSRNAYRTHWVKGGELQTGHMAELVRPIALGLLTDEEAKETAKKLNDMAMCRNYKVGTGFLSTPFLLQTLAKYGYLDTAYRMLENTEAPGWLAMVRAGATTIWEDYNCYDEHGSPLPHSFNHYSLGAAACFLFDTVCGISVTGENEIALCPQPGGSLTHARAETLTAYGKVASGWEKGKDGTIRYIFTIPANVTAKVVLPKGTRLTLPAGSYTVEE